MRESTRAPADRAHAIAVQPRAVDQHPGADRPGAGTDLIRHCPEHPGVEHHLAPARGDQLGKLPHHHAVVDDSGRSHAHRLDAADIRLDGAQSCGIELLHLEAVLQPAAIEFVQAGEFVLAGRNDELSTDPCLDALLPTERHHRGIARLAEPGLEAARLVINAGVDHPAVAAGLVSGETRLLLHHHHLGFGKPLLHRARHRQSHDPSAGHENVS